MKRTVIGWMVLFALMIPAKSFALANLIFNVTPGFFLYSPDAKGFRTSDGWKTDEISGYLSNIASVSAGVGVNTPVFFLDTTVGVGYMWSSSITSPVFLGDIAFRLKILRDEMTLGPHISFLFFRPDWDGITNITLSDETGVIGGLSFTIGTKAFSVLASLDYMHLAFKTEQPGISLNRNDLDMSGLVLQVGILMRF